MYKFTSNTLVEGFFSLKDYPEEELQRGNVESKYFVPSFSLPLLCIQGLNCILVAAPNQMNTRCASHVYFSTSYVPTASLAEEPQLVLRGEIEAGDESAGSDARCIISTVSYKDSYKKLLTIIYTYIGRLSSAIYSQETINGPRLVLNWKDLSTRILTLSLYCVTLLRYLLLLASRFLHDRQINFILPL